MQGWQRALWATELHIQPSTLIYRSLSYPLQGELQFRCQVWYLFCISFFCSVPQRTQCFPFTSNRRIPLWAVLYSCSNYVALWRIHFSLNSHPTQSPLSSITFSEDAPFAKCILQWSIPIKGGLTLLQDTGIWHNPICLPNRLPLQKVHSSARNILFTRFILLAGVFPLVSFPLHHFFLKVLFGSQIAETACDKASTSD